MYKILGKAKQLKGTNIFIRKDTTRTERKAQNILYKIKTELEMRDQQNKKLQIKLKGPRLFVNDKMFVWKNNALVCGSTNGVEKLQEISTYDITNFMATVGKEEQPADNEAGN